MRISRRAASGVSFFGVLALLVLSGCSGDGPTAPSFDSLQKVAETADIEFFAASGDYVDSEWQQRAHDWLEATLGVSLPRKLEYNKYASKAMMTALTGSRGNAWASDDPDRPAIHTIWSTDMHETVHVLSNQIGRPSDFFNEGLAVAHSGMNPVTGDLVPKWQGTPVHGVARGVRNRGDLPPLAEWIESDRFRALPDSVTYPCSGSFVRYLVDAHGLDAVLSLFPGASRQDGLATIRERFRFAFGISLETAESDWHRFLDG